MKVAVISDVHAHVDALEGVLAEAELASVDEVWFLGDAVGYGPFPNETVARLRAAAAVNIAGNHDLLVAGRLKFGEYRDHSMTAIDSANWTKVELSEDNLEWLKQLPKTDVRADFNLYHGARNSSLTYVLDNHDAASLFDSVRDDAGTAKHFLLGHVHWPRAWSFDESTADEYGFVPPVQHDTPDAATLEFQDKRWMLNPGSVGFSRIPRDTRAHWLLLDLDAGTASFKQTEVDHSRLRQAILDSGLPDKIAGKL